MRRDIKGIRAMNRILPGITLSLSLLFTPTLAKSALIAVEYGPDSPVYSVNTVDGSLTPVGMSGFTGLNSLAKNSRDTLYSVGVGNGTVNPWLITIDPLSGRGNPITEIEFGDLPGDVKALAFSPRDVLFASVGRTEGESIDGFGSHDLFTIDIDSGIPTGIGSARESDIRGIEFIGKLTVPEPSAAILFIPFAVVAILFRRTLLKKID